MKHPITAHRIALKVLVCVAALSGCVQNVPITPLDMQPSGYTASRPEIPVRLGVYIRDDVRGYSYRLSKLGMILQMDVGEYLLAQSTQMASRLFGEPVPVGSLPPYRRTPMPDVDVVMEPEITYFYTDSTGTVSGEIQSRIGIRINFYDLSGNLLWQAQAVGEAASPRLDLLYTFFQDRAMVGEVGQQALQNALSNIADTLRSARQKKVFMSELKPAPSTYAGKADRSGGASQAYLRQGMALLKEKSYQQALGSFLRAEAADPLDPYAKFYVSVCYAYSGQRQEAIDKLGEITGRKVDSKLQADTQKWITRLSEPLAIGLAVIAGQGAGSAESEILYGELSRSGVYRTVRLEPREYRRLKASPTGMHTLLNRLQSEGVKIVVVLDLEEAAKRMEAPQGLAGECASEFSVSIAAQVYSTKQKKLHSEFNLAESTAQMVGQPFAYRLEVFRRMLTRASDRALLKLLESDVI